MQVEALDRGDFEGVMNSVAADGVLDGRADLIEGRAAIRGFLEEWFGAYEELDFELEEVSHLGGGVVFAVVIQDGRLVATEGRVRQREGWVYLWAGRSIARLTTSEVDPARAAAEHLAREREQAVSQENVEIARRATRSLRDLLATFSDDVTWDNLNYGAEVPPEYRTVLHGRDEVGQMCRSWVAAWDDFTFAVEEIVAAGDRMVVVIHQTGRGRTSGLPMVHDYCQVWTLAAGRIVSVVVYQHRGDALKAVGLEG
jgi:ketosteroid isomerase-like protein